MVLVGVPVISVRQILTDLGHDSPYGGAMSGETDLAKMLSELSISVRSGQYCLVSLSTPPGELRDEAAAAIEEAEGTTLVLPTRVADREGLAYDFAATWLTLEVHSSLHAIGLTAAVADRLQAIGVPCNVLAGFYHDHLLVPVDRTADAIQALEART